MLEGGFNINIDETFDLRSKASTDKIMFDVKEVYNEIDYQMRNTSNAKLKSKLDRHDDLTNFEEGEGLFKNYG